MRTRWFHVPLSTLTHAIPRTNSQQPLTVDADILCVPVSRSHNVDRWQTILLGTQTCHSIFFLGAPSPSKVILRLVLPYEPGAALYVCTWAITAWEALLAWPTNVRNVCGLYISNPIQLNDTVPINREVCVCVCVCRNMLYTTDPDPLMRPGGWPRLAFGPWQRQHSFQCSSRFS